MKNKERIVYYIIYIITIISMFIGMGSVCILNNIEKSTLEKENEELRKKNIELEEVYNTYYDKDRIESRQEVCNYGGGNI